jgi:hypothetical protein
VNLPATATFPGCVLPPTVRLGGRRLLPLTLGHAVLLEAVESPFAPGGEITQLPGAGDNALAWWILTRPWQEARDGIDGRAARFWMWCYAQARRRFISEDSVVLIRWIAWSCKAPLFIKQRDGDGGERGTHPVLARCQTLSGNWGVPWPECLDVAWNTASILHLARWEEQGEIRVVNIEQHADGISRAEDPKQAAERQAWGEEIIRAKQAGKTEKGNP